MKTPRAPQQQIVYLVDDDEAFLDSLAWLVEAHGHTVRAYASAESFLSEATPQMAGCLVTDVRMDGMTGLELYDRLTSLGCTLPAIVISGHGDVPMAVSAFRLGAVDFVEKPVDDTYLINRINECLRRDRENRRDREHSQSVAGRLATLTVREREVFDCVIAGKLNKQIADMLGVSIKTVEVHRSRVMEKMQVHNVAELVKLGTEAKSSAK